MKILIVANADIGLYKFRKELLEKLVCEHDVFIALPRGEFFDDLVSIGCHYIVTDFDRHGTNPVEELKMILKYKKIIRNVKPDIVFTYTIKPNIYAGIVCARLNIPYLANITGLGTAVENPGIMQLITVRLYKYALRKAQKVFFQNHDNQQFMIDRNIVKNSYELIPGSGVNLEKYTVSEYPDGKTIDFAFISRIMKEKGIDQYIDMAKVIRAKYPETRFHVCGFCEQDYETTLKSLHENETIIYHGLVKDMSSIYKQMGCIIHPTYYPEGLSNVLLEAAASGRPIITTDRCGCKEVVDDNVNGFIVNQRDSIDLIHKVEKFLSLSFEQRKKMGIEGRKKVEAEFDRNIVINRYLEELEKIK